MLVCRDVAEYVEAGEEVGTMGTADGQEGLSDEDRVAVEFVDSQKVYRVALVDAAEQFRGEFRQDGREAEGYREAAAVAEVEVAVAAARLQPEEVVIQEFAIIVVVTDKDAVKDAR